MFNLIEMVAELSCTMLHMLAELLLRRDSIIQIKGNCRVKGLVHS
jgi:hypothetical protein